MKYKIETFLLVVSILFLFSSCKKEEQGTMWKVAFIDTHIKSQDYIHNPEEEGCHCGYQPYLMGSTFYKEPIGVDSLYMVDKFRQTYDEGYIPYAVYPYCSADDWVNSPRDIEYYNKRSTMVSSMDVCLKYGLIDSSGHYTN